MSLGVELRGEGRPGGGNHNLECQEPHGELDGCLHLLAHVDVNGDPVEIRVLSINHGTRKGVNSILDKDLLLPVFPLAPRHLYSVYRVCPATANDQTTTPVSMC